MTITVYRLTKQRYHNQMFSGLGGLYAHGRWSYRGRPVVYTSGSISLAVLEYTVHHKRRGWVPESVLGRAVIPDTVRIESVALKSLPSDWNDPDSPIALRDLGQAWLARSSTAVLQVPSAVIIEEWNYLLNPQHPDFQRLTFRAAEPFEFDRRVARVRKT